MRATAARYRGNLRNLALSFKSCSDKGKILAIGVEQYCVPRAPGAVYDFQPPQNLCLAVLAGEHIFPDAPPPVQIGMAKSTEFTKTERKVLRYLLRGLSYPCIASEMGIEMSTVKFHVTNMLQTSFNLRWLAACSMGMRKRMKTQRSEGFTSSPLFCVLACTQNLRHGAASVTAG